MNRNGSYPLSGGAIREISEHEVDRSKVLNVDYTLQILSLRKKEDGAKATNSGHIIFTCTLSDGEHKYTGFVLFAETSQTDLTVGDIIRAYNLSINMIQTQKSKVYVIKKFDVVEKAALQVGNPELLKDNNSASDSKDRQSVNPGNGTSARPAVTQAGGNNNQGNNQGINQGINSNATNQINNNQFNNNYSNFNNRSSFGEGCTDRGGKKNYYHPLGSLTTFTKDIQILVRCLKKTDVKNFNTRNSGSLFSFNIMDQEGSEMQVTCFNKACDKFFPLIEENKVYEIIGGYVKINDKKFSSVKSEYKLILEENTRIEEKEDDSSIKQISFNFVKILDVGALPVHSTVDVYGYVMEASEKVTKHTKMGKDAQIRKVVLVDDSEFKIEFTLWKTHADDERIVVGSVVSIKNAKVGDFNGRSLSTVDDTKILVDPEFPQVQELKYFFDNFKSEWRTFSGVSGSHGGNTEAAQNSPVICIKDALSILDAGEPDDRIGTVKIKATICTINHSEKNFYAGCPEKICKKKLVPETYGFSCPNCQTQKNPMYYYTLSL